MDSNLSNSREGTVFSFKINQMIINSVWFKTMEKKITGYILNLILAGMIVLIGLTLYWSLKPYNIIEYKIDKFEMQKEVYEVGEPLTYRIAFCKNGEYRGEVIRNIRDGVVYSFPLITSDIPEGCSDFISSSNITPNVPSGVYTFENEIIYQPNPIRTIRYTMSSEPFEIVNNN